MKLLIVFPGPLYPVTGMSQVRAVNQIKRLSADHQVTLVDILSRSSHISECETQLGPYLKAYLPVYFSSVKYNKIIRAIRYGFVRLAWLLSFFSMEELTLNTK